MKQPLIFSLVGLFLIPSLISAQSHEKNNESAFLGIYSKKISSHKAGKLGFENLYGSYVSGVIDNTAAEKAGVQAFDYLIGINEFRTSPDQSFISLLCQYDPDDKVELHFVRNGASMSSDITLGSRADIREIKFNKMDRAFFGVEPAGGYAKHNELGVAIDVIPKSAAEQMELQDGDILSRINGHPIIDWDDISIAIDELQAGDDIQVEIVRNDQRIISSGQVDSYGETLERRKCKKQENENDSGSLGASTEDYDQWGVANNNEVFLPQMDQPYAVPEVILEEVEFGELTDHESNPLVDLSMTNDLKVEKLNFYGAEERGIFHLTFLLANTADTSVKIFNQAGRIIYQYDLEQFGGTFRDEVDLSDTPHGHYYLEISQNDTSINKKIMLE